MFSILTFLIWTNCFHPSSIFGGLATVHCCKISCNQAVMASYFKNLDNWHHNQHFSHSSTLYNLSLLVFCVCFCLQRSSPNPSHARQDKFQSQGIAYEIPFHPKAKQKHIVVFLPHSHNKNTKISDSKEWHFSPALQCFPQCIDLALDKYELPICSEAEKTECFLLHFPIFSRVAYYGFYNSTNGKDFDNPLLPFLIIYLREQIQCTWPYPYFYLKTEIEF